MVYLFNLSTILIAEYFKIVYIYKVYNYIKFALYSRTEHTQLINVIINFFLNSLYIMRFIPAMLDQFSTFPEF